MLPTFLTNEALKLLFFGGKGGVGKTTTAAASAILLAEKYPDKKILLISTDPAHSLFDSFEIEKQRSREARSRDEISILPSLNNLCLREFDAAAALDRFKKKYGKEIKLIADRGTYFDNEDINSFFDLSFPGIDEVMGILEIAELVDEYGAVMIDTAPAGHTLSMLKLPAILKKWLLVFSLIGEKHHILEEHFARHRSHDEADAFIETINSKLTRVNNLLCNTTETEFVVVTNPEEMALDETERLLRGLFALKIPVRTLVINRVAEGERCHYCERRKSQQRPFIDKLEQKASYEKVTIPLFPSEIRGIERLKLFASWLSGEAKKQEAEKQEAEKKSLHLASLPLCFLDNMKLIMVGGKGGVGKTTTASATALLLAEKNPDKTYHLYSIDPAHSLGDCFRKAIGDKGAQILPNLHVFELDADKLYLKFKEEYRSAIDELFDAFAGGASYERGIDFGHDRELLNEFMEMSPPGLNELMALHKVISDIDKASEELALPVRARGLPCRLQGGQGGWGEGARLGERVVPTIIIDTAPTGHFVRFLELPSLVRKWLNAIFELLLKYKGVVQLGEVAEKLINLSKNIRFVMDVITDHKKTAAIVVTIPKAMAVAEAERLINALKAGKIQCDWVVVNMAAVAGDCSLCTAYAADEAEWIEQAKKLCRNAAVVPYIAEDMGGVENLKKFGKMMWK